MHFNFVITAGLLATEAISQYSSIGESCSWPETIPSCDFTNSEGAKTGDLVNSWKFKEWTIEGGYGNDCSTLADLDDCCEEYVTGYSPRFKRLWCKELGQ